MLFFAVSKSVHLQQVAERIKSDVNKAGPMLLKAFKESYWSNHSALCIPTFYRLVQTAFNQFTACLKKKTDYIKPLPRSVRDRGALLEYGGLVCTSEMLFVLAELLPLPSPHKHKGSSRRSSESQPAALLLGTGWCALLHSGHQKHQLDARRSFLSLNTHL